RMLAIQGLMNSDPDRALPLLEKVLNGTGTPREKSKALFVIAQSGKAEARQILGRIASGQSNPELQRKSVEYLGMFGGSEAHKTRSCVVPRSGSWDSSTPRTPRRRSKPSTQRKPIGSCVKKC